MVDVTGAKIQVPAELEDLPMKITNTCTQIEDLLNALNAKLQVLHEFWSGSAAMGHQGVHAQWNTAEGNLLTGVGVLGTLARSTQVNWENYVHGEGANTQSWAT
jgi:uncharacterized protein YukE